MVSCRICTTKSTFHSPSSILHNINYAKLWTISSNAHFCNLYNRKCDFSPLRAPLAPGLFRHGFAQSLCASIRWPAPGWHAGFLAFAAACCAACPSTGAMLALLRARLGLPRCSAGLRRAWPQVGRVRVAAQLRPRSATTTVRRRVWLAPWPDCPCGPCRWTRPGIGGQAWHGGRGALTAQRSVCGSSNRVPGGLRHAGARI